MLLIRSSTEVVERQTPVSDSALDSLRSLNELIDGSNPRHSHCVRATSEPLLNTVQRFSARTPGTIRAHINGDEPNNSTHDPFPTGSAFQGDSQKRKANDDGLQRDDGGNNDEDGHGSSGKRPRTFGNDHRSTKERLPCIFHVGEPEHYSDHTKRYENISNLL